VKNSQDVYNIPFLPSQVRYAVVTVQQDSYFSLSFNTMYVAYFGELAEYLGFVVDAFYNPDRGIWIIGRDIVVNILGQVSASDVHLISATI
jgi:hypothetical protein